MAFITCSGSIALDTTRTPFKTVENVLGGAASYFSLSARFFADVHISSVVGDDFPQEYWDLLETQGIDLEGVQKKKGKTFHYDCSYSFDLYQRFTNKTDLNLLGVYEPWVPEKSRNNEFVYLATMPPAKQREILRQHTGSKFSMMDTIEFYIRGEYQDLLETMKLVDCVVLNDAEARMLGEDSNLVKCGKKISKMGPKIVIIKKGEHGCILFFEKHVVPFPAFPLENVVDPNGAGDSFAGGFMGSLAKQNAKKPTLENLKQAMAYANVMGSIVVSDYSVVPLSTSKIEDVEKRYKEYVDLLRV
ncbi:MAG: PfkB family carbohydrate kinase [Candidatus Micrarchaeota archaeon]